MKGDEKTPLGGNKFLLLALLSPHFHLFEFPFYLIVHHVSSPDSATESEAAV